MEGEARELINPRLSIANSSHLCFSMSLGPGVPDPPQGISVSLQRAPHPLTDGFHVAWRAILGPLHHEYSLMPPAT